MNTQSVNSKTDKHTAGSADEITRGKKRKKSSKTFKGIMIGLGIVVLLFAVVIIAGRLCITVDLVGERECSVEYGSSYSDAGAVAMFGGKWFFPKVIHLDTNCSGEIDTTKLGTQKLTYEAKYLIFSSSATRTVHVIDTVPPVIELKTVEGWYTEWGEPYNEEGYTATDNADGDITANVESREENGIVYYTVKDSSGNKASAEREIFYYDPTAPELTLLGGETVTIDAGQTFDDPGYTAIDNIDGDITAGVIVSGSIDPYIPGEYTLEYTIEDSDHNTASATRKVVVNTVRQPDNVVPGDRNIYLTFDDGPGGYTQQLLGILRQYNVKATFFVVSNGRSNLIASEAAAGHSVGIHSATHDYKKIYASEEAYFADLEEMNEIIKAQTGSYTNLVRFPGGSSNTVSRFNPGIMSRLTAAVTENGYQYFDWNVDSNDAGGSKTPEEVFQNVIDGVKGRRNSVVLMHDIKSYSVAAVERIIVWGIVNGYTFLPLDENSPTAHHGIKN